MAPENARSWQFMAPEIAISCLPVIGDLWLFLTFCLFLMIPLSLANYGYVIHEF
jgi:hypothetical protein